MTVELRPAGYDGGFGHYAGRPLSRADTKELGRAYS